MPREIREVKEDGLKKDNPSSLFNEGYSENSNKAPLEPKVTELLDALRSDRDNKINNYQHNRATQHYKNLTFQDRLRHYPEDHAIEYSFYDSLQNSYQEKKRAIEKLTPKDLKTVGNIFNNLNAGKLSEAGEELLKLKPDTQHLADSSKNWIAILKLNLQRTGLDKKFDFYGATNPTQKTLAWGIRNLHTDEHYYFGYEDKDK